MASSRPKLSHLYTLSQSKLLENHTLHSGTCLYSPCMAVSPPPPPPSPITLFCTFLCSHCITTTWNDQILTLLRNGNGKAINSTISVWTRARSPLFSSSQNPLPLNNRVNWDNREKVQKGCEVDVSVTFSWTSPLSDRKVPIYTQTSVKNPRRDSGGWGPLNALLRLETFIEFLKLADCAKNWRIKTFWLTIKSEKIEKNFRTYS